MQYQLPHIGRALGWAYRNGLWGTVPSMATPIFPSEWQPKPDILVKAAYLKLRGHIADGMVFLAPGEPGDHEFPVKLEQRKTGYRFNFPSKVLAFLKQIEADQVIVFGERGFGISTMTTMAQHYPGFNFNVPEFVGSVYGMPERETPWSVIVPQRGESLALDPRDISDFLEPLPALYWVRRMPVLTSTVLVISKTPSEGAEARYLSTNGKLLITPEDYLGVTNISRDSLRIQAVPGFGWLVHRTTRAPVLAQVEPSSATVSDTAGFSLEAYLSELPVIGQKDLTVLRFRGYLTALDIAGRLLGWAGFSFNDRLNVVRGQGCLQLVRGQQLAPRVSRRCVLNNFAIRVSHNDLAWLGDLSDKVSVLVQEGRVTIFNKKLPSTIPVIESTQPPIAYPTVSKLADGSFHIPRNLLGAFTTDHQRFDIQAYRTEIQLHSSPTGEFALREDGSLHIPAEHTGRFKFATAAFCANLRHAYLGRPLTGAN